MVVYLAALQSISPTYYDAAQMDGASRWQQFRFVTWPLLRPATFLLLILGVIHSFQVFDLIYVMTGGGPRFLDDDDRHSTSTRPPSSVRRWAMPAPWAWSCS
jgi:ABC-type sugar transport system permease subunit